MYQRPGIKICIAMRNFDQVFKFHIEAIGRDFEWLSASIKRTMPASLKIGKSQLDFSYGENLDDIERRFRSANYDVICVDQAEQFSERELREMRKAARSKTGIAKFLLLFNMRGAGIDNLRNWFHLHKVGTGEEATDYVFLKMNPWDTIFWVADALKEDGYTAQDYYFGWTDEQRRDYSIKRGPYVKQMAAGAEVISKADLYGDWDSIEGTYFSHVFDLDNTMISAGKCEALRKPWAIHWMCQDFGTAHFTATYWNFRVSLSPSEVQLHLGWIVPAPLTVIVTYRELILNGMAAGDQARMTADAVARKMASVTPDLERKQIRSYFLSPECVTGDPNCIGQQQAKELKTFGMPSPAKADNERVGGWQLMAKLLRASKYCGMDPETGQLPDVWLISSECAQLLEAIPKLIRDPKNLDDVLKTDKANADVSADVADAIRYGLKTMLSPRKKNAEDAHQEAMEAAANNPALAAMLHAQHYFKTQAKSAPKPGWQQRLELLGGR